MAMWMMLRMKVMMVEEDLAGASKKKRRGSAHECPICHKHGRHWNTCRDGDPKAKEALALLAVQRKAEKKRKTQEMASIEGGGKRKNINPSKRSRSAPVPNQIEAPPTCLPLVPYGATSSQPASVSAAGPTTTKGKGKGKGKNEKG